jgi:hypothetical protein
VKSGAQLLPLKFPLELSRSQLLNGAGGDAFLPKIGAQPETRLLLSVTLLVI